MSIFPDNGEGILAAADPPGSGCTCPDALGVVWHALEARPIAPCPTHGEHPDNPEPVVLDSLAAQIAAHFTPTTKES